MTPGLGEQALPMTAPGMRAVLATAEIIARPSGWEHWLGKYDGVALLTVALLPFAALTVWALARRRRLTGSTSARAWRTSLADVGIIVGTLPSVWVTMLPGSRAGTVPGRVSLIPLRDLVTMGTSRSSATC